MTWIVQVVDERNRVRYWSPDQDLIYEREGAKKFGQLVDAVKQGRAILRDHGDRFAVKTLRTA